MYSITEISDRTEIQHRLNLYCHALDARRWDELDQIFLPDAVMDFGCLGLAPLTWLEMKEYLRAGQAPAFEQHIYANTYVTFSDGGQIALTLTKVFAPQVMLGPDGDMHCFGNHGEYHDEWAKTDAGWRVRHRRWEHKFWSGDYPFGGLLTRASQYELVDQAIEQRR